MKELTAEQSFDEALQRASIWAPNPIPVTSLRLIEEIPDGLTDLAGDTVPLEDTSLPFGGNVAPAYWSPGGKREILDIRPLGDHD